MGAYSSFGTLLQMADSGGTAFTTIGGVLDIKGPKISVDTAETTNQSSTEGWAEYLPTIKRGGEITFTINYDPNDATHEAAATGIMYVLGALAKRAFRVVMPTSASKMWAASGYITGFEPTNPVQGIQAANVTIKITGKPSIS